MDYSHLVADPEEEGPEYGEGLRQDSGNLLPARWESPKNLNCKPCEGAMWKRPRDGSGRRRQVGHRAGIGNRVAAAGVPGLKIQS